LNDIKEKYIFNFDEALEYLIQEKSGYYSMTTQGLDFSWSDLINELLKQNIIFNSNEGLFSSLIENGIEKGIADYIVTSYNNGVISQLCLSEKILSLIREFENQAVEV